MFIYPWLTGRKKCRVLSVQRCALPRSAFHSRQARRTRHDTGSRSVGVALLWQRKWDSAFSSPPITWTATSHWLLPSKSTWSFVTRSVHQCPSAHIQWLTGRVSSSRFAGARSSSSSSSLARLQLSLRERGERVLSVIYFFGGSFFFNRNIIPLLTHIARKGVPFCYIARQYNVDVVAGRRAPSPWLQKQADLSELTRVFYREAEWPEANNQGAR